MMVPVVIFLVFWFFGQNVLLLMSELDCPGVGLCS